MSPLARILALIWAQERRSLLRGAALSLAVLAAGAALLGLSGWFIAAAAAAGLSGALFDVFRPAALFDVFRPAAGVRGLALGRTAARYGERLLTHDATLRALAGLRVRLLRGYLAAPLREMAGLRAPGALNRVTADVEALDGVALRLFLPAAAGAATLALGAGLLAWLTHPLLALTAAGGQALGAALSLALAGRGARRASRREGAAARTFRLRVAEHLRARAELALAGALAGSEAAALDADLRRRAAAREVQRAEAGTGFGLALTGTLAAGATLLVGALLAQGGEVSAAQAALAFFAAMGLGEATAAAPRGVAEFGRMRDAARRVAARLPEDSGPEDAGPEDLGAADPGAAGAGVAGAGAAGAPRPVPVPAFGVPALEVRGLTLRAPGGPDGRPGPALTEGFDLRVEAGETVGLTGASGAGKSTLLAALAGLLPVPPGRVRLGGRALEAWPEAELRAVLGLLPQRAALIGGTVRENLTLAAPEADDAALSAALADCALDGALAPRGGLDLRLGEAGQGLSGGEARRLALARTLLRAPRALLLDEPTEGLDDATARRVLAALRRRLPQAAILVASHRAAEADWCSRRVPLR